MQWVVTMIFQAENGDGLSEIRFTEDNGIPELAYRSSINFGIPDIIIAYTKAPPPADKEKLDEWGVEAEKVSTVKKEVYIVRNPTYEMAKDMLNFSGLLSAYRPTNTAITVHSLLSYMDIVSRVSMVAIGLQAIASKKIHMNLVGNGYTVAPSSGAPMETDEEGEVAEERPEKIQINGRTLEPYFVATEPSIETCRPWGSVEDFLGLSVGGIFCPFEINFAAPDPIVLSRFIQRFSSMFIDEVGEDADSTELEGLQAVWATEISNTLAGHHLAHTMVSLMLAADSGAYTYILQLPEQHYDGTIIVKEVGKLSLRGAGLQAVHSVGPDALKKELSDFGFHTIIVSQILDLVGASAVAAETIESMRHLREVVFAGTGIPSGNIRNKIQRLLPKLAFKERVLGINENAINEVLRLLTTDAAIPRSMYLSTGSFFVEDTNRTQLVLSAWGDKPPTFNYGGTPLYATGTKGKGASAKLKDYNSAPPLVLQVKRVPMETAVAGWNTMLQQGYINGDYSRKLSGARSFNGPEKTRVWQILNKWISTTVVPKGAVDVDMSQAGGSGIKRGPADDNTVGERGLKKKRRLLD